MNHPAEFPAPPQSFFLKAYDGTPPWEVGRPQPALVALADAGDIRGGVLDVGCGTGELAIELAKRGHEVLGVDMAPKAIAAAQRKAAERGVAVTFLVHSALDLSALGRTFDTAIDSGLYHVFDDADRRRYVDGLGQVVRPGGVLYVLCFSDKERSEIGPRRVTPEELRTTFADGWRVDWVREARYESLAHEGGAQALLMRAVKT